MPTYERNPESVERSGLGMPAATLQVGFDTKNDLWFASVMDGDQRKPLNRFSTFETFIQDLSFIHGYSLPPNMIAELLYLKIYPSQIGDWTTDLQGWMPAARDETTCWTCRQDCDPAYLKNRNCTECRAKYTNPEISAIDRFAEGYIACLKAKNSAGFGAIDEWCAIPSDPTIDINFVSDEEGQGDAFRAIQAWAYRRDKVKVGDCDDELRVR